MANRNIRWKDIIGFNSILNSIYADLTTKEPSKISQTCINLMKSFINDGRIMNKFINIIICNTNVYDSNSVIKVFDILDSFFKEYQANINISSFKFKVDYNIIFKSISIILNQDCYLSISKVFWFLYNNAHLMNLDRLSKFSKYIFNEKFFDIFFHWSYQVRNFFFYFLHFTIGHKLKNNIDNCFGIDGDDAISGMRKQILLEKIIEKDNRGFSLAVKEDYLKQIKTMILNDYYEKMRIIVLIESQVEKFKKNKLKLESTLKSISLENNIDLSSPKSNYTENLFNKHFAEEDLIEFILKNVTLKNALTNVRKEYIISSINHYLDLKAQFKIWEKETKQTKEVIYPTIQFFRLKDDVINID